MNTERFYNGIKHPIFKAQAKKLLQAKSKKERTENFINSLKKLDLILNRKEFRLSINSKYFKMFCTKDDVSKIDLEEMKFLMFLNIFSDENKDKLTLPKYIKETLYLGPGALKYELTFLIKYLTGYSYDAQTKKPEQYLSKIEKKYSKLKKFISILKDLNYKNFQLLFKDLGIFDNNVTIHFGINSYEENETEIQNVKTLINMFKFHVDLYKRLIEEDIILYLENSVELFQIFLNTIKCKDTPLSQMKLFDLISFIEFIESLGDSTINYPKEYYKYARVIPWEIITRPCVEDQLKKILKKSKKGE